MCIRDSVVPEMLALREDVAGIHADPEAVLATMPLGCGVIEIPNLDPSSVVPPDPGPVHRVIPVVGRRQVGASMVPEFAAAVDAVADTVPLQPCLLYTSDAAD